MQGEHVGGPRAGQGHRSNPPGPGHPELFHEILPDAIKSRSKRPAALKPKAGRVKEKKMAERRALIEGLKNPPSTVDPSTEERFVFGAKKPKEPVASETTTPTAVHAPGKTHARVPLSTRMRSDFATALKRASLERQRAGVEPNTLQDFLEPAVEPWLRSNGSLKIAHVLQERGGVRHRVAPAKKGNSLPKGLSRKYLRTE